MNIINTRTLQVTKVIPGLFGPFGIDLTKDGRYAYITNFGSNDFAPYGIDVAIVDIVKGRIIGFIETGIQPAGIVIDEKFAYVSNYNALYAKPNFAQLTYGEGTVSIIDINEDKVVKNIPVGQTPSTVTLSPCGKKLYVCKYVQNTVNAIDLR